MNEEFDRIEHELNQLLITAVMNLEPQELGPFLGGMWDAYIDLHDARNP